MTGYENHSGFTISGSKLQVVEINQKNDQFILENVDEAYFNEPLNLETDKETKISALLQGAFNELMIRKPLNSSLISFALPFDLFYTMQVPYDNTLLHQDLIEEFRWELSVLHPYISVKDLAIQYIEIEKNDIVLTNSAFVIGIQRKYLQLFHTFCHQNNLKLKFIDNVHIASERALSVASSLNDKGNVLSIYFNNKFLSIIFSVNAKPVYFKVIPLNDAGQIPELLLKEISPREGFNISPALIDTAYISGENISGSLVSTLNEAVKIDFNYFNPFDKINPNPKLYDNKCYIEKYNSFSPAAGIAYRLA